jgi:hypothetical protein
MRAGQHGAQPSAHACMQGSMGPSTVRMHAGQRGRALLVEVSTEEA